jgi:hypothetical protein
MADNFVINGTSVGSGPNIALDDVGGVLFQRVKIAAGADGSATDVSSSAPLPTTESDGGTISAVNSTTSTLTSGSVFTGTGEDVSDYASITVTLIASHVSATDGLQLQQSHDNTNWDYVDSYTIPATTGKQYAQQVSARYFRVVYTNGGTGQTTFRLQTIFHKFLIPTSVIRPQDARTNETDVQEVMAYQGVFNGTTWDRARGDTANGMDVDVTRVPTDPFGANADAASATGSISAKLRFIAATGIPITTLPTLANVTTVGTVTTCSTLTNITNWGNLVDDAAATPATTRVLMVGYMADDTATDSVDEGDGGMARMTLNRKQITQPYESEANTWSYAAAAGGLVNTTGVTAKAAAGAGLRNYITSIQVTNSNQTTGTEVLVRDGAAGTVLHRGWANANSGYTATFPIALRGTANTLVEIAEVTTTATAGVLVNLQGYVGA